MTADELAHLRVRVDDADHTWFRSILEAYDGLVTWHSEGSGVFTLSTPRARAGELEELIADLVGESEGSVLVLG